MSMAVAAVAGIRLDSAWLPCRDFPEARYRQSRGIGLLQGARESCRRTAPHALVVGVAVKCRQHALDQRIRVERTTRQCGLDADHLAGYRVGKFPVL